MLNITEETAISLLRDADMLGLPGLVGILTKVDEKRELAEWIDALKGRIETASDFCCTTFNPPVPIQNEKVCRKLQSAEKLTDTARDLLEQALSLVESIEEDSIKDSTPNYRVLDSKDRGKHIYMLSANPGPYNAARVLNVADMNLIIMEKPNATK
jgi:hypothetical protein